TLADVRLRGTRRTVQTEMHVGGCLKDDPEFEVDGKMPSPRQQIAEAEQQHWRGLSELDRPGARYRIGAIAEESRVPQAKGIETRHPGRSLAAISVVHQQARADVKSASDVLIEEDLGGAKV